jgi:hypothetical protein
MAQILLSLLVDLVTKLKVRRKKILILLLVLIIGAPMLFTLAMQTTAVQTKFIGSVLQMYAKKMNGNISIGSIYFSPFTGLNIDELYIEDDRQDTLLFAEKLSASIKDINYKKSEFYLNKVVLENAFYNLYSINELEQTNMQFIINYFKKEEKDSLKPYFLLKANDISVKNLRFKYIKLKPDSSFEGVNFGDIEIRQFNLEAEDFQIIRDSMNVNIKDLQIIEKSGLKIEDLHGQAVICNSEISVNRMVLKTEHSHLLTNYYSMKYDKWKDLGKFTQKVRIKSDINLSTIDFKDIAYFAPQLKKFNFPLYARGEVYGTINRLKSNQFFISSGQNSLIETKFRMQGLPNVDETFINFDIKRMHLDFDDLEDILYKRDSANFTPLPSVVKKLEHVNYKGNITGFLTDMVAYGTFNNKEGVIETDLRFKYSLDHKNSLFTGKINTEDLKLSFLNLSDTIFDNLSMSGTVETFIDSNLQVTGNVIGNISEVGVKRYQYNNIDFRAQLEKDILNSTIDIRDTNINMFLVSTIDFSEKDTDYDIVCNLEKANLSNLNLVPKKRHSLLQLDLNTKFSNLDFDHFRGYFNLSNIKYADKDINLETSHFNINSIKEHNKRTINFDSELLEGHLEGEFYSKHLISYLWEIKNQHLGSIETEYQTKKLPQQNIKFSFKFIQAYDILKSLYPKMVIADNSELKGIFNSDQNKLKVLFETDSCKLNNIYGKDLRFTLDGYKRRINTDLSVQCIKLSKDISVKQFYAENSLHADSLNTYVTWYDTNATNQTAEILSETTFFKSTLDSICCDINFVPSYLFIEDSIWYINDSKIKIRDDQTSIEQFMLNHDEQYLYADGVWQKKSTDSLNIYLNEINLDYFPIIQEKTKLDIDGLVNGEITLGFVNENRWLNGFIKTNQLKINKELLGDIQCQAKWEAVNKSIAVNLVNTIGDKKLETIKASGIIKLASEQFTGNLILNKQKLDFFQPFFHPYISNTKGFVSGGAQFKGWTDSLNYSGTLDFFKTSTTVDYLGTRYNFTDKVYFNQNEIKIDNIEVFEVDGKGDLAVVDGSIYHQHFRNFNFDLNAQLKNFMTLNTGPKDNELFYGVGYLSGVADLSGTDKNTVIKISGSSDKNTKFYIPLTDSEEASSSNFISFVNTESNNTIEETYQADLSGIILDFDLTVTPDAEVQIIFDQQLGDIVKANGSGLLNLDINTIGNFTMSGDYTIENGEYLFTLGNVLNKKFKIEQGGNIKWNGDPYQAYIDLNAIYRLKTPLFDLTQDIEDKERIPVECHLNMKNQLSNPDIAFDVKLPSSGDKAKALLSAMDEDERNKQVLSLLVLNSFYTPDYLRGGEETGSGNAVGKNASELLSNQLSNWLSSVSDDFDIGVNYRPSDGISNDEIELALSTQLFNDRVAIDGNVGVGKYNNNNTTSNVIGTVNVDVKINKKGSLRIRGFNRANDNEFENNSLYTQGVGLYYREDFDTFNELLSRYWKAISFKNDKDSSKTPMPTDKQ